jgi:23S rRNA pseudouridine2457 synthase
MLIAFNKPYGVVCQFSPSGEKQTLKHFVKLPGVYPAGRLDTDSEGLLLLTDEGQLQARISNPRHHVSKVYWAEVEGQVTTEHLNRLRSPLNLGDFVAEPALSARLLDSAPIWERVPPVRFRATIPTTWIELTIAEGKNRQVRRMTAKVGLPTLRLIRMNIGQVGLLDLGIAPGEWVELAKSDVFAPDDQKNRQKPRKTPKIERLNEKKNVEIVSIYCQPAKILRVNTVTGKRTRALKASSQYLSLTLTTLTHK